MSTNFQCLVCGDRFTTKRALVSHEDGKICQKHKRKAGESSEGVTCELCGARINRSHDIPRHQQQARCLKAQAVNTQQKVPATSNKRKCDADDSDDSNKRKQTTSPAPTNDLSDSTLRFDPSDRDTVSPCRAEQAGAGAISTSQGLSSNAGESGTTTSTPLPPGVADQDGAVHTDMEAMDVRADAIDGVQQHAYLSPLIDTGVAGNGATPALASPDNQGSQELPVNDNLDGIPTESAVESSTCALERTSMERKSSFAVSDDLEAPSGGMESLTHALERTSMETKSSFALSAVSQTRSSVRSLFYPSESIRPSSWTKFSERSSESLKRASTVPSEMAPPFLERIDEELVNSRESGSRLKRYVPSMPSMFRKDKKVCNERLWIAVQAGITEEVADILASGSNTIDINRPDTNFWSPLITAAFYGHEEIVAILLDQSGIDVNFRDPIGLTASMYAHHLEHSEIEAMFKAYELSKTDNLQQKDHIRQYYHRSLHDKQKLRQLREKRLVVDDEGICSEKPSQPQWRLSSVIARSSRNLWQACEQGDADVVARLITETRVDPNSLNPHHRTPLSIAASYGHESVVRNLLKYGEVDVGVQDANGATALTWAASRGHLGVLEMLLNSEPATDHNQAIRCAALMLAQRNGHDSVVKALMMNLS
jgi:ankyrin repeat protein